MRNKSVTVSFIELQMEVRMYRFLLILLLFSPHIFVNASGASSKQKENKLGNQNSKHGKQANLPKAPMNIVPPILNFKERPLCVPAMEKFHIINTSEKDELTISSIAIDSPHFFITFRDQTISSSGNTSISVVFLPRQVGEVENTLIIQTNSGAFLYEIQGTGIPSPYKVTPLIGAKVLSSVTYNRSIDMYNPYSEILHISEVFTSGGFLQLNLPQNSMDSHGLWDLAPHKMKNIINLEFSSDNPGKYQGYVNIKTNKDNMLVPVEVLVVKEGLHLMPEEIDFGTVTSISENKTVSISMLNGGSYAVQVTELYIVSNTADPQIFVNFTDTIIGPGVELRIATLSFVGKTEGNFVGKLLMNTNDSNPAYSRFEIPYQARVLYGSLAYNMEDTMFRPQTDGEGKGKVSRAIRFTNRFPVAIKIFSVEISDSNYEINASTPVVISAGDSWDGLVVNFAPNNTQMMFTANMEVTTNISMITVPLHCYHGQLGYTVLAETEQKSSSRKHNSQKLDFGSFAVGENRTRKLVITNENPVGIPIYQFNSTLGSQLSIALHSSSTANVEILKNQTHETALLKPGQSAIFECHLQLLGDIKSNAGELQIRTPYQVLKIPVLYHSVNGNIRLINNSKEVAFAEPSFPGRTVTAPLVFRTTFGIPVEVLSIVSKDPRIHAVILNTTILPDAVAEVGYLVLDVSKGLEMDKVTTNWEDFTSADMITKEHLKELKRRELYWEELRSTGADTIRTTLTLKTDVVASITLPVHASIIKPTLFPDSAVKFPRTQIVSSTSEHNVSVYNPADVPVLVQTLPLLSTENHPIFSVSNDSLQEVLVPPHSHREIGSVQFAPMQPTSYQTTLYIRNNLTILDSVLLQGEGGTGNFVFVDAATTVPLDSLNFELLLKDLKSCKKVGFPSDKEVPGAPAKSGVVVTKDFTAHNAGDLPVSVFGMHVDDEPCGGYGFLIHDCEPFALKPLESKNISVSFRPEYTDSAHHLDVSTSQGILRFALMGSLPYDYLPLCSNSQPQVEFENSLQRTLVIVIVTIFVMLLSCSLIEYHSNGQKYLLRPIAILSKDALALELEMDNLLENSLEMVEPCTDGVLSYHMLDSPSTSVQNKDKDKPMTKEVKQASASPNENGLPQEPSPPSEPEKPKNNVRKRSNSSDREVTKKQVHIEYSNKLASSSDALIERPVTKKPIETPTVQTDTKTKATKEEKRKTPPKSMDVPKVIPTPTPTPTPLPIANHEPVEAQSSIPKQPVRTIPEEAHNKATRKEKEPEKKGDESPPNTEPEIRANVLKMENKIERKRSDAKDKANIQPAVVQTKVQQQNALPKQRVKPQPKPQHQLPPPIQHAPKQYQPTVEHPKQPPSIPPETPPQHLQPPPPIQPIPRPQKQEEQVPSFPIREEPITADPVNHSSLYSGITGMNTAGDLLHVPRRDNSIGVIGSGKNRRFDDDVFTSHRTGIWNQLPQPALSLDSNVQLPLPFPPPSAFPTFGFPQSTPAVFSAPDPQFTSLFSAPLHPDSFFSTTSQDPQFDFFVPYPSSHLHSGPILAPNTPPEQSDVNPLNNDVLTSYSLFDAPPSKRNE